MERPQRDGPAQLHQVPFVRLILHDVAHALVDDHLADDVRAQGAQDVHRVAQLPAPQEDLLVGAHGDPAGKDLQRAVHVAAPQQVVDALGAGGARGLGVARPVGEEVPQLGVRQDSAVPVGGHLDGVGGLDVGGRGVVRGDPGGEPGARPGAQGLILPVEVPASIGAQEGVRNADLVHRHLGAGLHVQRLRQLERKVGIRARDPPPGVHVDRRHVRLLSPKAEGCSRELAGRGPVRNPSPVEPRGQ